MRPILFAIASMMLPAATVGAGPASATLPDVTVTAPRPPTPGELAGESLPNFVHAHAKPAIVTGQLARWRYGICPSTRGLSPGLNDFVSARILAIAASVGAPHEAGQCKQNVLILFTAEPQKVLDAIVKQNSAVLGYHYPQHTDELKTIHGPIQGWYVTASRGAHGDESIDDAAPILPTDRNPMNYGQHPAGRPGSRLSSGISSAIVNVLIVADANKVVGHEIGTISDYLAMLTLTQAFATDQCGVLPSIMDLMLPSCGDRESPAGITAGDLAFLRALYHTDIEAILPLQRSGILDSMTRQFNSH